MKNSVLTLYGILLITSLVFINISCTRTPPPPPPIIRVPPPPPPPPTISNRSSWVNANMNITIELPMNFAILTGSVTGSGTNGSRVRWKQISGPAGCIIENPDSVITRVSSLLIGSYQFELTASTISGETMSDTMALKVQEPTSSSNQIFFSDLDWVCPWGCGISLGYSLSFIPAGNPITVYIRRENMSNWKLVVPLSVFTTQEYFYDIWSGQLSVYQNLNIEPTDHPEIKIVF